ncbi:hypothetical protein K440DRAFT_631497 [Wilcoxina mikolae CBS 423.85]|nr:hypothetical protein K440DRAFT_631497 [Wilcoxina mikolae CBS 423.85]
MPAATMRPVQSHSYYDDFPSVKFRNLDTDSYQECEDAIKHHSTKNFIVDFGGAAQDGGQAWCALDVDPKTLNIREFLSKKRELRLRTRWINIFNPYDQADLVDAITSFYGFSPRLGKVITTPPALPPRPGTPSLRPSVRLRDRFLGRTSGEVTDTEAPPAAPSQFLLPPMPATNEPMRVGQTLEMVGMSNAMNPGNKMNYMNLVRNVWHFHAVEWGGRFICLGFNNHHKTSPETWDPKPEPPKLDDDEEEVFDTGDYNPEGKRVWSWLILCDDGTVISIQEPLGPGMNPSDVLTIRRNMLTVFRSLSLSPAAKASSAKADNSAVGSGMDDLPFRRHQAQSENVHGGPSLLFYYLFDDWISTYSFVLGRGAPYSTHMRDLRNQMHKDPQLSHLSKLHRLSRQLATLKRMYETKKIIVDNVLNRQENSHSRKTGQVQKWVDERDPNDPSISYAATMGDSDVLGVPLGPLSVAKFERLRDRIKLYALGELEALLLEKTELETLTFNLISLKQSTTVELLTRVTIWFAGFTFVFLPLTLVTGYFSMQLKGISDKYTERTFWGAGGVAVTITFLILYTVGKSTGTIEFGIMWKSIKKVWFSWLDKKRDRKKRKHGQVVVSGAGI